MHIRKILDGSLFIAGNFCALNNISLRRILFISAVDQSSKEVQSSQNSK